MVRPAVVDVCSCPIVAIAAIEQLPGAGRYSRRRPHGEPQCAKRCCHGGFVKDHANELLSNTLRHTWKPIGVTCSSVIKKAAPCAGRIWSQIKWGNKKTRSMSGSLEVLAERGAPQAPMKGGELNGASALQMMKVMVLRSRLSGAGFKSPAAAGVKSSCSEHVGKVVCKTADVDSKGERKRTYRATHRNHV